MPLSNKKNLLSLKIKKLYVAKHKSVPEIARVLRCSEHRINYWIAKNRITKRTISEAIYLKYNPKGDPFQFEPPKNFREAKLFGLGLGLYWGEGNKLNKNTVKLGNSDPVLLRNFIKFLIRFFHIKKRNLKFHLHIFSDIKVNDSYNYWMKELKIRKDQFYKPTITRTGKLGTYRNKSKYGVLTIYYGNTKLKNRIVELLAEIAQSAEHAHGKRKVPGSNPGLGLKIYGKKTIHKTSMRRMQKD